LNALKTYLNYENLSVLIEDFAVILDLDSF